MTEQDNEQLALPTVHCTVVSIRQSTHVQDSLSMAVVEKYVTQLSHLATTVLCRYVHKLKFWSVYALLPL